MINLCRATLYPKRLTLHNDASLRLRVPVLYPVTTLEARLQSLESGKRPYLRASRGVIVTIGSLTALMSFKNLGWLSHPTSKAGTNMWAESACGSM
jgi:NAD(P)-dependent dehydrogenase (short-subunit alcohol dehydrogenase family)